MPTIRFAPLSLTLLLLVPACGGAAQSNASATAPAAAATPAAPLSPGFIPVTLEMGDPHEGDAAPDFTLSDQTGNVVKLSSLRGSVVVLSFVTSWCPFSKAEQPNLAKLPEQYQGKNVKFIAVDVKEPEADYRAYLARVAMPFPVLKDESGDTSRSYAPPKALPSFKERSQVVVTSNLVIDPEGVIRFYGLVDTENFDAELQHVRHTVDELLARATGASATAK